MKKIIIVIMLGIMFSCGNSEIEVKKQEFINFIEQNPGDIVLNRSYLNFLFLEASQAEETISFYEENKKLLQDDVISSCIYGAALCSYGGAAKKIEDKLMFLKKGMLMLDKSVDIAEDYNPLIWRIQTYSNFPQIMNVRSIVETDIENVMKEYVLPLGALFQVYSAQLNVAREYKDKSLLDDTVKSIKELFPEDIQKPLLEKSTIIVKEIGA